MAKRATGHVRWFDGIAVARIRVTSAARQSFALPSCRTDGEARERARLLAEVANQMRLVGVEKDKAQKALEMLASATPRSLPNAVAVARELAGGELRPRSAPSAPTFKRIGEQWTSGELAKQCPDQIRVKRSAHTDVSRLTLYVYPVLQNVSIDCVTLDHCEEVMRSLPSKLSTATRQRLGALMARILAMAVYPLRLIERSPLPRGFVPAAGKPKALAYVYPDEDRRLMTCQTVPLEYRLLWGVLSREGMREGEALGLAWTDLDLARGAVRLDKNKTDDPRAWALNPSVAAALRLYKERYRPNAQPASPVFVGPSGQPHNKYGLADMLRAHLVEIGLVRERPELFTTTAERRRIRVHDLRGTFVTISLANGRSESWIGDRTGHRSSQMIARYKRNARTFSELDLGELAPLGEAIPELSIGPGLGRGEKVEIESSMISVGHLGVEPRANGLRIHCSTS
jgi:integrase